VRERLAREGQAAHVDALVHAAECRGHARPQQAGVAKPTHQFTHAAVYGIGVPLGAFDETRHLSQRESIHRGHERAVPVVEERPFEKRAVRHGS